MSHFGGCEIVGCGTVGLGKKVNGMEGCPASTFKKIG
jgi:hypothetical protein